MTKIGLWLGAAAVAALAYITAVSPALQQGLGASAAAIVRPLVIPLIELINVPAFVYCAALVIFMAGLAACVVYQIAAVRPYLAELRAVRSAVGDLPQPRLNGVVTAEAWAEARQHLGTLLQSCPLRRCLVGLPGRIAARPRGSKSPFFQLCRGRAQRRRPLWIIPAPRRSDLATLYERSSSGQLPGSTGVAAWQRTGSASTKTR